MRLTVAQATLCLGLVSLAVLGSGSIVACGSDEGDGAAADGGNGNCVPGQPCEGGIVTDGGLVIPDDKCDETGPEPTPVTGHPRLFLTAADLPRLRSWANAFEVRNWPRAMPPLPTAPAVSPAGTLKRSLQYAPAT